MSSFLHQLLVDVFRAQGMADADRAAKVAVDTLMKVEVLPEAEVQRFELDARIYHLRGQRLTAVVISERVGQTERQVYRAIRRHIAKRRAALKQSA